MKSHLHWYLQALLFDCLHMGDPITLAFNSAHVPHLFDYKSDGLYSGLHGSLGQSRQIGKETMSKISSHDGKDLAAPDKLENTNPSEGGGEAEARQPMAQDDPSTAGALSSNIELPSSIHELLASHASFLLRQAESRSQTLVSCLIEQVQTDSLVAHHLWVLLFPIVWTSLQKDHQTGLAKPLIQLLSKEHHLRQAYLRPTVGQTLLDGISMSQPQPKIPAEMIKYMGRHFHAWHTAISLLESHVGLFPLDMRCFDAVCDLYTALGEDDMRCGLWQKRAGAEETKTAIALQAHGFVSDAQSMYLEMMSRGVSGGVTGVTKNEMVLWHNQYLACCMELNQWDTVAEYAKSIDNSALQLEAAAKLHDWVHLKQMVVPKAQVEDGAEFTLIKAQLQLSEMSLIDVDKLCKSALSQYVNRWWQMPESSPGTYAQLMHGFQRAVELMETWRVMMEFSAQGGPGGHYQDLKDIADTWKLRTPNEWEPIKWWSDVLTWRNQVYNMTIRQFSSLQSAAPTLHQMGYRDKAWSVNRLGHIARVHHLPDTCVHIINTLYGFNAMEVQEAFVKVQEQAKAYMMKRSEHLHGLNLLNSTNMDYFQAPHQAEMVCLKAQFLHLLNENDTANAAFSESLTLWSLCPDAWVNWGRFCDDRYMASKQEASTKQQKPDLSWLEFASTCYMQGIRLSGLEARVLVPRVLQLLMLDVNGSTVVGRSLVSQAGDLPTWVWLPWIPQLLTSLQRDDFAVARRILLACASQHPQYMFWQVRPSYGTMRDQAIKAVSSAKDRTSADQQKLGTEVPSPTMREGGTNPMKVAQPVLASQDSSSKADEEMVDAQAQTLKSEDQISPSNPQQRASSGARSMDQANSTAAPQNVSSGRPSASAVEKPMEVRTYYCETELLCFFFPWNIKDRCSTLLTYDEPNSAGRYVLINFCIL